MLGSGGGRVLQHVLHTYVRVSQIRTTRYLWRYCLADFRQGGISQSIADQYSIHCVDMHSLKVDAQHVRFVRL